MATAANKIVSKIAVEAVLERLNLKFSSSPNHGGRQGFLGRSLLVMSDGKR